MKLVYIGFRSWLGGFIHHSAGEFDEVTELQSVYEVQRSGARSKERKRIWMIALFSGSVRCKVGGREGAFGRIFVAGSRS